MVRQHDDNQKRQSIPAKLASNAALGAFLGAVFSAILLAIDFAGIASLIGKSDYQMLFTTTFIVHLMATFAVALVATALSSSDE